MFYLLRFGILGGMDMYWHDNSCWLRSFLVREEAVQWPLVCDKMVYYKCGAVVGFL